MNRLAFRSVATFAIACCVVGAVAQASPAGKWKGKLELNNAKVPKPKNEQEKKQMEAGLSLIQKTTFTIDLKKDFTFTAAVIPPRGEKQLTTGLWKYSAGTLSTQGKVLNGKPIPANELKWRTMVLSKDGKTLSRVIEESKGQLKIVFKRA